ncbi:MAG: EamA family transporter [Actinomycetota bacterium]
MSKKALGYLAVSAAAVLWALGGTYASDLIDRGASFVELTEARAWITALVLLIVVSVRGSRPQDRAAAAKAPFWVTLLFGCSIAAANLTYYASLSRLPVAIAITVQYTAPGLVVAWTALAGRDRASRRVVGALVAAIVGVALLAELPVLIGEGHLRVDGIGLLVAGVSAFAFATYILSGQHVGRAFGPRGSVLRGFLVSSAIWIVVQAARGRPDTLLDTEFLPGILFLAVATTIAPFMLFVWGLEHVSPSDAGIVSTLEPLAAALFAFLWLGQSLSGWQLAGAALVIAGIGIVQTERPERKDVLAERAAIE